jgi:hypothetical protein
MRTVRADGSCLYDSTSDDSGSNLKGIVLSLPVVVVSACTIDEESNWGIRNVDVHPAPRIKTSTE